MSLNYGLNLKKKTAAPTRRTLKGLDDEDGDDDEPEQVRQVEEEISMFGGSKSASRSKPSLARGLTGRPKPGLQKKDGEDFGADLSALQASKAQVKAAQQVDETIFDYDSFHDAKQSVANAKKAASKQDAIERKPKYINNLLDAAERRKKDQQVAMEKKLQRDREEEGDEFADKENFVTGAYKQQQEENKRLEEEERKKAEEEAEKKKRLGLGNGMQGFYRTMMDQTEQQHREAVEAAEKAERAGVKLSDNKKQKSDAELAAELALQGKNVHINEDGQITDKRELLTAGLNIVPSGKAKDGHAADHLKASNRPSHFAFNGRKNDARQETRERQSQLMEEQLAVQAKRVREEEEEERARLEKAAKSQKTEQDVSDAKARYLARKAAKEKERSGG
ncbi:hypothetical protein DOTSEDRAFT_169961 [Dothistroma septosporum NZE10]|uniref:Nuclear speckle splicing regulatory protein 1 N-terminal domain-containing protein n=1 Tax=Dothistroma septosporum (strain NZE10 / CBS 128990) TaxID=675120 RepID=N1PRB0_DOTSN|nr:hypothetical protein DOTSEDRAFT_169961 [Dothistroma septosporum NZE10]